MIKYFSMPADFNNGTIDAYDRLNRSYKNSKIIETYGNITIGNQVGSGRAVDQLPETDLLDLRLFIEYSRQKGIDFNYTLNATHLGNREFTRQGILEIKRFLTDLYEAGVRSITVSLPSLMELIRAEGYDFEVKASTLCQITNANKAAAFKNRGVQRIVVDESINRDVRTLRRIREVFGDKVELIINPLCLKDCTYRTFHYNQITEDSLGKANDISVNYYEHRCVLQRNAKISNLLRMCFLRPEDLKYYTGIGIHYFKLQGRHLVKKGDPIKTIKAYFDEKYDGDLMDLIYMFYSQNSFRVPFDNRKLDGFIDPFFKTDDFCRRDCEKCGYCERFARKIIDYNNAGEIIRAAETFYQEFDKFNRMLRSVTVEKEDETVKPDDINAAVDFDLD